MYVVFLLNNCWNDTIQATPLQKATGQVNDISPLLTFYWWQPVYYCQNEASFPKDTKEGRGHWVGVAEHVGHVMTYKILTDDTHKVIY